MNFDQDLAIAIQISLQEERKRREEVSKDMKFPSIYETRHSCDSFQSVFSLQLEDCCFICGAIIDVQKDVLIHSSPIKGSDQRGRSICIRPTIGSFAIYSERSLLHCGITDMKGIVHNFDEAGVHAEVWKECIEVPLNFPFMTDEEWDAALYRHHKDERTRKNQFEGYKQLSNNCYDYIIRFLNSIQFQGRTNHTKEDIIQQFILKPMEYFESYFQLLKKVQHKRNFIGTFSEPKTRYTCDGCGKNDLQTGDRFRCHECEGFDLCRECKEKNMETGNHKRDHRMEEIRKGVTYFCDICGKQNLLFGDHIRCLECEDFDICSSCCKKESETAQHKKQHKLLKL